MIQKGKEISVPLCLRGEILELLQKVADGVGDVVDLRRSQSGIDAEEQGVVHDEISVVQSAHDTMGDRHVSRLPQEVAGK